MSYAKQKGTAFETAIVKYLNECGMVTPRRIALSGAAGDKGDIWVGDNPIKPYLIIECKNYAKELSYGLIEDFVAEAHTEYKNAICTDDVDYCKALLIVKRVNLGVADSWLIWKNPNGFTVRARLGDVINKDTFKTCSNDEQRLNKLVALLQGFPF